MTLETLSTKNVERCVREPEARAMYTTLVATGNHVGLRAARRTRRRSRSFHGVEKRKKKVSLFIENRPIRSGAFYS